MITKHNNTQQRLLSLDVMRGITIAGMILVNNPGSWQNMYAPMKHADWNGLTPTDLVFPFFMFIMGVSTYMSLKKFNFEPSKTVIWKIIYRTILIFAIGLLINWVARFCSYLSKETIMDAAVHVFERLRIMGVLQRLALAYGVAAIIAVFVNHKKIVWVIASLLIIYSAMLIFGHGFEISDNNIIAAIDQAILGKNHMYRQEDFNGNVVAFDPEGLVGTISSVAHVLIGFLFGRTLVMEKDNNKKVEKMLVWGTILMFLGFALHYGCPINKKIWSPTFVMVSTGMAAQFLALLIWIVDIKKQNKWTPFFRTFGVNPLMIFIFSDAVAILISAIKVEHQAHLTSLRQYIYINIVKPIDTQEFGSLLFSLMFLIVCWLFGYILWKKNIYVKL